jgi:dienelactone hydrolase
MATIVLFHHVQGRTPGVLAFADELRAHGHAVHAPDLLEGRTFATIDEGVAHVQEIGFDTVIGRGVDAAAGLPADVIYAGFSLGVLPAQNLAQTNPGARGALFFHACAPPSAFGTPWPAGVPLQVHMMKDDPWVGEDLPAAQALVKEVADAELFLYPGNRHLFADPGSADYDAAAAALLMERVTAFLQRVG